MFHPSSKKIVAKPQSARVPDRRPGKAHVATMSVLQESTEEALYGKEWKSVRISRAACTGANDAPS